MSIDREIKTDLRNILSMVSCAFQYGHAGQIFFGFAANLAGKVTDEEIDEYVNGEGYGEEDYEDVMEILKNWKTDYVDKE